MYMRLISSIVYSLLEIIYSRLLFIFVALLKGLLSTI